MQTKEEATKEIIKGLKDMLRRSTHKDKEIINQYGEFEYATSSGETGTASFCTVSYGQSRCQTDDGTTIMVERYTKKMSS